ncbi:MAG: integrase core domain-containing protein [Polyangiales bacterium]
MPWKVTEPMQERIKFIEEWLTTRHTMVDLCRKYGVTRKTGYKWVQRFKDGGTPSLCDASRAPLLHPNAIEETMVELVIGIRRRHPQWGPKKLRARLLQQGYHPPAASTIGGILRREGLVGAKRRRPRPGCFADGLSPQDQPNALWAADFKGHFKLKDGRKCYPLTISDGYSRFFLRCEALEHPDEMSSFEVFDAAFCEYGLPLVMRTDNGVPFSATYGISALSAWWVELGVRPERIARGKPTQNGRHERLHRTLKLEAIQSEGPKSNFWRQQRVFDRFRKEYNEERPHEALGLQTPAALYETSSRPYPVKAREPEYGDDVLVYRVKRDGSIVHEGHELFISSVLKGKPVGLSKQDDDSWGIHFGPLFLGSLSATGRITRGHKQRRRGRGPNDEIPTIANT